MANQTKQVRTPQRSGSHGWDSTDTQAATPLALMRQMQDEIGRWFGRAWSESGWTGTGAQLGEWSPAVDVFQRGNEYVVRADLPGMSKDDITVEANDDSITIRGERSYEHDEERQGLFRSERRYGSFVRLVPLPEGALPESATANFKNGVLEVTVQSPPHEVRRGRRVDIKESTHESSGPKKTA